MALSAAVHHSFDKVAAEAKYSSLRAQKTDRAEAAHNAADLAPMVQILDGPVPLMVGQLVEVFKALDIVVPEHVIDVPKVSQDRISQRSVDRDAQMAEQLVGGSADSPCLRPSSHRPWCAWLWRSPRIPPRTEFSSF